MKTISITLVLALCLSAALGQNIRNVLIEYSTATNCGHCPCMDSIVEQVIMVKHPNTAAVAYHNNNLSDPFGNFLGTEIIFELGIFANPTALANRGSSGHLDYDHLKGIVDSIYLAAPLSPLSIESKYKNWNGSRRMFDLNLALTPQQDLQGNIAYNMIIIENNLIFYQSGHSDRCFGGENYKHDLVARVLSGGITGSNITSPDSVWRSGSSKLLPVFWCLDMGMVPENCQVIFFVFDRKEPLAKSDILQSVKYDLTQSIGMDEQKDTENEGIINVYPNPSSGKVNLHFRVRSNSPAGIEITATDGNKTTLLPTSMVKAGVYNMEIGKDDLADGFYLLSLTIGERLYTSKLIIKH